MSLRIDSVLWFQYHKFNNSDTKDLEELYTIGSCYVKTVKNEIEHYPGIENENEVERIPITKSLSNSWCNAERNGTKCSRQSGGSYPCQYTHYSDLCTDQDEDPTGKCKLYQCRSEITKWNRLKVWCGFHADPDFRIYAGKITKPSGYPYFIVSARSNATPVITLNPTKHCINEEYVKTSDAWQAVLLTLIYMKTELKLDKLPLNRIYINFGNWMQQRADDSTRRKCHAHINIVLSHETIEKINQLYKSTGDPLDRYFNSKDKKKDQRILFPALVGSVLPPEFHRLDDSWELIKYMHDNTGTCIDYTKSKTNDRYLCFKNCSGKTSRRK